MRKMLVAGLVGLALSGCTIAKVNGRGAMPIMLNNPTSRVAVVKHVEVSKIRAFDYTNTFDVSELMSEEIAQNSADAVINTAVSVRSTPATFFINLFTLGFANAMDVAVTADIVRYEPVAAPVPPPPAAAPVPAKYRPRS